MIEREKRGIKEQEKNEQLMKEKENSKLKITNTGVYFLPQGEKTVKTGSNKKKRVASKNEQNKNVSKPTSVLSKKIEDKISYLFNKMTVKDTDEKLEFEITEKDFLIPYYQNEKEIKEKEVKKYIPDYELNAIVYRGFYRRGNDVTGVVTYKGKLNYVKLDGFLDNTVLSVEDITDDFIVFKDNKSEDKIKIEK